jgi:predicted O-methyltransferase YrrM
MMEKIPYMTSDEIVDLVSYLDRDSEVLEIGGGGSTLFISRIVKKLITIEHNFEWSNRIKNRMASLSKKSDWEIHIVPPAWPQVHPFQPAEPGQFDSYVEFISGLEKESFDVILIDGRDRVRCFQSSLSLLKKGGTILIHDFWNREKYHSILDIPEINLIVKEKSTSNTLAAFVKI